MTGSRVLLLVVSSLMLAAAVGCSGGSKKASTTPTPTSVGGPGSPEEALAQFVQTTLQKTLVADCAPLDQAKDDSKMCAIPKGDRDQLKAYLVGPNSKEPAQWVILQNQGGQWKVVLTDPITQDNVSVPGVPWPLTTGVDVVVTGADPCLNVREGPALETKAVDCIKNGSTIKLAAGPVIGQKDGMQWYQVEGRSGWVAADFIRYPDAAQ